MGSKHPPPHPELQHSAELLILKVAAVVVINPSSLPVGDELRLHCSVMDSVQPVGNVQKWNTVIFNGVMSGCVAWKLHTADEVSRR